MFHRSACDLVFVFFFVNGQGSTTNFTLFFRRQRQSGIRESFGFRIVFSSLGNFDLWVEVHTCEKVDFRPFLTDFAYVLAVLMCMNRPCCGQETPIFGVSGTTIVTFVFGIRFSSLGPFDSWIAVHTCEKVDFRSLLTDFAYVLAVLMCMNMPCC